MKCLFDWRIYRLFPLAGIVPLGGLFTLRLTQNTILSDVSTAGGYVLLALLAYEILCRLSTFLSPDFTPRRVPAAAFAIAVAAIVAVHIYAGYLNLEKASGGAGAAQRSLVSSYFYVQARHAALIILSACVLLQIKWAVRYRGNWQYLFIPFLLFVGYAFASFHIYLRIRQQGDYLPLAFALLPLALAGVMLAIAALRWPYLRFYLLPENMPPVMDGFDRNNRITLWLFGLLVPVVASAGSFILAIISVWAIISLVLRRYALAIGWPARIVGGVGILYFLVFSLSALINMDSRADLNAVLFVSPFLSIILLASRWRLSPLGVLFPYLAQGAAFGLLAFGVFGLWEFLFFGNGFHRIEVFSGNSVPAAYMAAILATVVIFRVHLLSPRQRIFHLVSICAGTLGVLLTGSISVVAGLAMTVCIPLFRYRGSIGAWIGNRRRAGRRLLFPSIFVLFGAVLAAIPVVSRIHDYRTAVENLDSGEQYPSLQRRLVMWRAGLEAFGNAPFFGFGPQNRFDAIQPYLTASERGEIHYSHVHNGFLTAGLAGGIPGIVVTVMLLIAPAFAVWRFSPPAQKADLLLLAAATSLIYAIAGMVGIMFFHDALDALYCLIAMIVSASIGPAIRPHSR